MPASTLDWLFGLGQFGIKFGLDNMRALVGELGQPQLAFPAVHIAGTNGKGSVTAIVDTALRAAGLRVGRYTSPHLIDVTERVAVDGSPVASDVLLGAVEQVRGAVERLQQRGALEVHPTFFEITTAAALVVFRAARVDIAACEVGLGGRLDATNVLQPLACAITSIGFDHQQYLGDTLGQIAYEKAGIIKPGIPVVVGPVGDEAAAVISRRAADVGAPLCAAFDGVAAATLAVQADGSQRLRLRTPEHDYGELTLALAGAHQVANAVVAVRMLETLAARGVCVRPEHIQRGLSEVHWPGRLQRVDLPGGRTALLDAAHNEAGARALAAHLVSAVPTPLVLAAMRDKDVTAMVCALAPVVDEFVLTRASNPRSFAPADLADVVHRAAPMARISIAADVPAALATAWSRGPHIVVAGSIFLIGDVMNELGPS